MTHPVPPHRKSIFGVSIPGASLGRRECSGVLVSVSEPIQTLILPLDAHSEADPDVRQPWGKDALFNFNGTAVRIGFEIVSPGTVLRTVQFVSKRHTTMIKHDSKPLESKRLSADLCEGTFRVHRASPAVPPKDKSLRGYA